MSQPSKESQALDLPVASLLALRHALEAELGADGAARALRRAGHAAGDALFTSLADAAGGTPPGELDEADFWATLDALFAERGWGHLTFEAAHEGIGSLESSDWAEADPAEAAGRPSCHFTAGMLANLLGRSAGGDIGILEVECRSKGDLRCRFLFGGRAALERVFAGLNAGRTVDHLLAELG